MSEIDLSLPVDSPDLPVDEGVVHTAKQFSDGLTMELTDDEIQRALRIIVPISKRYRARFASKLRHANFTVEEAMKLIDEMEDELVTRLAESLNLIATVDASPVFEGQPVIIDMVGALPDHYSASYGFDHEKKGWEVKRAKDRGEIFLGAERLES